MVINKDDYYRLLKPEVVSEIPGTELYDLLPEGMDIVTTEEEIRNLVQYQLQNSYKDRKYKLVSGTIFNSSPVTASFVKRFI